MSSVSLRAYLKVKYLLNYLTQMRVYFDDGGDDGDDEWRRHVSKSIMLVQLFLAN